MSRGAPSRCDEAVARCLEDRRRKRKLASLELEPATTPPPVCTKPGCGGRLFIPHEDGWQCFNCMKIIYRSQPPVLCNPDSQ
ncbi:MAG TPA: hypothetical protein G4N90_04105 [Dehalococcoidia bacterium]|nr:hypothetical protein [Dehalococcoidia bacterium]